MGISEDEQRLRDLTPEGELIAGDAIEELVVFFVQANEALGPSKCGVLGSGVFV